MFSFATVLSLGLAFTLPRALAANATCEDSWMFIDIHYRQVDARPDTFSYGLFIGVGTSSQNQSLWPSVIYNETRIASNDFCASATPPAHCDDPRYTHGHFGADVSSTWQQTPQYSSLDAHASTTEYNATYGQDQLNMFTHYFDPSPATNYPLHNHPITVLSDAASLDDVFFDSGTLGLGSSSTVIKQLIDQGRIDRNVVSMYLGTAYPRAGGTQNGSIVIGGYDAGRFVGEPHKYDFSPTSSPYASPLQVHVKQLSLVTQDGTTIPFVTDDGFDAHISTHQYPMELPHDVMKLLATGIGATPANNDEGSLQAAQPFKGNLTITLDDGYEITFPPEWITNASNLTPFSATTLDTDNTTIGTTGPLIFGAAFLHHLYMTIDYEASNFYLADAKVYDNYVQPQPLCANQIPAPAAKPHMSKFLQSGLIGAILGGIIGGSALIWVIIFFIRKQAQHRQANNRINKMEGGGVAGSQKKGSMRTRSILKVGRHRNRASKDVTFGDVKRVSISDSEPEVMPDKKKAVVSVAPPKDHYEMSRLDGVQSKTEVNSTVGQIPTTTITRPDTDSDSNPPAYYIASPLPTPFTATTPHTGNPLLGNGPKTSMYAQYNDRDDSDIPADYRQSQPQHTRGVSLTLDTGMSSKNSAGVKQSQPRQKQKLAPLKLEQYQSKSSRRGGSENGDGGMRFLRRMFPAS